MKFYAEITQDNQPKNKAEKAGSELLKTLHKALIPSEEVRDRLIEDMRAVIPQINKENLRCGDIGSCVYRVPETDLITFSIGFCTTISFKPITQEY
ncbi:MAG: hypothetical protein JEZ14_25820 [Marinilabiliaceae bacterium]|nr:hypothetical protein [Marinilabiliaceae bacterium]